MSSKKVMLPDGTTVTVDDVPEGFDGEELRKLVYAQNKIPYRGPLEDAGRSFASGLPFGVSQTATMVPKAVLGAIAQANSIIRSPAVDSYLKERTGMLAKHERQFQADSGADYQPQTKAGEWAKAGGAALAAPAQGPGGVAINLAGGLAANAAEEAGLGPVGGIVASMVPGTAATAVKGMRPGFAFGRVRDAVAELTPEQRTLIHQRMNYGNQTGLNPMLWQAAGEETGLRRVGLGAATHESAKGMQARVQEQYPRAVTRGQETVRQATKRHFPNKEPISPDLAQDIRNTLQDIAIHRDLAPRGDSARYLNAVADQVGRDARVPWTPQQITQRIQDIGQELINLPPANAAQRAALHAERTALLRGIVPEDTVFQPGVSNFGQLENVRQSLNFAPGTNITPDKGVKWAADRAIQRVGGTAHPPYKEALRHYGRVKDAVENIGDTAKAVAGRHLDSAEAQASRLTAEHAVPYAIATNPAWAVMPPLKKAIERQLTKDYDKMFQAKTLDELSQLASRNPGKEALLQAMITFLSPVNQGYLQVPEEPQKRGTVTGE